MISRVSGGAVGADRNAGGPAAGWYRGSGGVRRDIYRCDVVGVEIGYISRSAVGRYRYGDRARTDRDRRSGGVGRRGDRDDRAVGDIDDVGRGPVGSDRDRYGLPPTAMGVPAVFVAVVTGVTVPPVVLAT